MVSINNSFIFSRLPQVFFGVGSFNQLSKLINTEKGNILLVTGQNSFDKGNLKFRTETLLNKINCKYYRYQIKGEPSPSDIDQAVSGFKVNNISTLLAIGGGSVLDAGKAIAAMFCEEGSVKDYLEGVGTMSPSGNRIRLIAVPTTAGTGSEATKNAVISEFGKNGFKKSLRHENYIPDVAIIDPELVKECPPEITGASGMDAFSQLMESYLSTKSNPMTDALALSGLERVARSLKEAFFNGNNIDARTDISYAALISGITLANAGLGLVHGFAQPLGSLFPIPHGIVCGSMMPAVNKITVARLKNESVRHFAFQKYALIGRLFTDRIQDDNYYIELLIDIIQEYKHIFKIPGLSKFGVLQTDFQDIIDRTENKNHPIIIDSNDLNKILELSL